MTQKTLNISRLGLIQDGNIKANLFFNNENAWKVWLSLFQQSCLLAAAARTFSHMLDLVIGQFYLHIIVIIIFILIIVIIIAIIITKIMLSRSKSSLCSHHSVWTHPLSQHISRWPAEPILIKKKQEKTQLVSDFLKNHDQNSTLIRFLGWGGGGFALHTHRDWAHCKF